MLQDNVTALIQLRQSWPILSSLLLHGALLSLCCAIPHTPKMQDCIMIDLQMPRLGIPGPMAGRPASGPPKDMPAAKMAQPAPPAAPARRETHEHTLPAKPRAATIVQQKASAPTPAPSSVSQGAIAEGTAKGQPVGSTSHGGSGGGGAAQVSGASSGGGSGAGGSAGSGKQFEGDFGAQGGPSYLHKVLPAYPRFAQRIGKEGTVLLRLTLDESGNLKKVEVLEKGGHGFDESAVAAVKASRFRPALRNGRPVPCRVLLPVRFELQD